MWRRILAVIFVLCWSASIALAQPERGSVNLPVNVAAGTEWSGHENLAGYGPLRFVFSGSNVTMYDKDGATPGTWTLENGITMTFYSGEVVYNSPTVPVQMCNYVRSFRRTMDDSYAFSVGVACSGARLGGQARNTHDGRTWNWSVTMAPMPIEVNGTYSGAPFGFTIPVGRDGQGNGEAILGLVNPDPAMLTWRMRLVGTFNWITP